MIHIFFRIFFLLLLSTGFITLQISNVSTVFAAKKKKKKAVKKIEKASIEFDSINKTSNKMDLRAHQKREEAVKKLQKLLPTVRGSVKADLTFRLAEMYWATSKYKNAVMMEKLGVALDKFYANKSKGSKPRQKNFKEYKSVKSYEKKSRNLYSSILKKYPRYTRKDEVLYNLGSSYYQSGYKKRGYKMYLKLIREYPKSDFISDTWLQLGEHFLKANKVNRALKSYRKAAKTAKGKKPDIYSFATYKMAWSYYNLNVYDESLENFLEVINHSKRQIALGKAGRLELINQVFYDIINVYADLEDVDDAIAFYLKHVGKEKSYKYFQRLVTRFPSRSTRIDMYREMNKKYPYNLRAAENQANIMRLFNELEKRDQVRKEIKILIALYGPDGDWAKHNSGKPKILAEAFETVEEKLSELVSEQHRGAQKTKITADYRLARDVYKKYLDTFEKGINSYRFRFAYAEILFELKEFQKAAHEYDKVVLNTSGKKFDKPAAYASILAWQKVVDGVQEDVGIRIDQIKSGRKKGKIKKLEEVKKLVKGTDYTPKELSSHEKSLVDSCDRYIKLASNDKNLDKIVFTTAQIYYKKNHFSLAAERFGSIIEKWPKRKLAQVGVELILQSFTVRSDWKNLNIWSRSFRKNKILMSSKSFVKRVNQLIQGATFNEILYIYEPKEDKVKIGDRYLAFVKEFPRSQYSMVALFNAVVKFEQANFLDLSISVANRIIKDYKDFKITKKSSKNSEKSLPKPNIIRKKVLLLLASYHERLAEFDKSASFYEQYAKEFLKDKTPKVADALFNASIIREKLTHFSKSLKSLRTYMKTYPKKKDVPDIYWRIGLILEKQKKYSIAQKHFNGYRRYFVKNPLRSFCSNFKIIDMITKQKLDVNKKLLEDLVVSYKKLSSSDKTDTCALKGVATAIFLLLEPEYKAYNEITLKGVSENQMAVNLVKKIQLVAELEKKYLELLKVGEGDYGISALYRIGKVYQNLAQEILDTQCPKRLDEDQCSIYLAALQEKAFPLEEKAIDAFDKTLSKAYELHIYNDWLKKAQDTLKIYEPLRFPNIRRYSLVSPDIFSKKPELLELKK